MVQKGEIHIGTSGWHYGHWKGPFYPEDISDPQMLPFYVDRFRTVEINNSFYHLPSEKSFRKWSETVPEGFVFAVKASRYITHMKKLKDPEEPVRTFLDRASAMGRRMGPVLFQLPPNWNCNPGRLGKFLASLPGGCRYAFEFRDPRWFIPEIYRLLRDTGAAFCIFELAGTMSPREVTADFIYIRLHGPDGPYAGSYDNKALGGWAGTISGWAGEGRDVYCYFDNDQCAYAAQNALSLQEMLS